MSTEFVTVKRFALHDSDWNSQHSRYVSLPDTFNTKKTFPYSILLSEIVGVNHRPSTVTLTNDPCGLNPGATCKIILFYEIKVKTADSCGINGFENRIKVSETSYKMICDRLGISAVAE